MISWTALEADPVVLDSLVPLINTCDGRSEIARAASLDRRPAGPNSTVIQRVVRVDRLRVDLRCFEQLQNRLQWLSHMG